MTQPALHLTAEERFALLQHHQIRIVRPTEPRYEPRRYVGPSEIHIVAVECDGVRQVLHIQLTRMLY